ncbi:MAG: abortive infection family protein [Proteobacteria bacterium]|nr:abortive infection family protein [Pseudomonadota bacterium]
MTGFKLQSAREILEIAPAANHIKVQIDAIENAIEKSPSFVFDHSKSLVDTVCKTILLDREIKPSRGWTSPQLFERTLKALKLHHDDVDETDKTYKSLKKTAEGLQEAMFGICQLRNTHGLIGHGQDAYAASLEAIHAQFVASAADTLVHILYMSHKGHALNEGTTRVFYQDYEEENARIDEIYDDDTLAEFVKGFRASEVLFKIDKDAYRAVIDDIKNEATL